MADDQDINLTRGIYRRLYSGALTGRRVNAVSELAELLLWRLLMVADDFGRYHADPEILASQAFPIRRISPERIAKWHTELERANLVSTYRVGGESYGEIVGFVEMQPANRSGRRVQRIPPPGTNGPGESGGVPGNPGESRGIRGPSSPSSSPSSSPEPDPGSPYPTLPGGKGNPVEAIRSAIELSGPYESAQAMHAGIVAALTSQGFTCQSEVAVPDRGDGRSGKIDIVVRAGEAAIFLELDRISPRLKSIQKLSECKGARVVVLRSGIWVGDPPPGLDAILSVKHQPASKRVKWKPTDLESIYGLYPRKAAKQASLRETSRAIDLLAARNGDGDPVEWLRAKVIEYAASPAGQAPAVPADDRRWYCRTFMKEGHYDDPAAEWQRSNGPGVSGGERAAQSKAGGGAEAARSRRAEKAGREFPEHPSL